MNGKRIFMAMKRYYLSLVKLQSALQMAQITEDNCKHLVASEWQTETTNAISKRAAVQKNGTKHVIIIIERCKYRCDPMDRIKRLQQQQKKKPNEREENERCLGRTMSKSPTNSHCKHKPWSLYDRCNLLGFASKTLGLVFVYNRYWYKLWFVGLGCCWCVF